MLDSITEEIEQGWKLLNEGKEEEALGLAAEIEKKEDLSPEEKLNVVILKGNIYYALGDLQKGFKLAEEIYEEYERLGNDYFLIDALNLKLWYLLSQGQILSKPAFNLLQKGETILKSISEETSSRIVIKEARFLYMKGVMNFNRGNYDLAMKCCEKSLELMDQFKIDSLEDQKYRRYILSLIGIIYTNIGELKLALEYHEKSLALKTGDTNLELILDANEYWEIGYAYFLKGDLDNSQKFFKKTLTILKDLNFLVKFAPVSAATLQGLIKVLIAKGDHEGAQQHLQLFKQINDERPLPQNVSMYKLLRARVLKSSTRPRDRAEAERILKKVIEKEKYFSWLVINALTEICDLYIEELKLTKDITIIDEIKPYISQLLEQTEKDYSLLAKTKLLQARIALFQMNMGDARRLLTQAQEIADENGYQHLAQTISIEHDNLLGQLDVLENLKKTNIPISRRMSLASLSGSISNLIETQEEKTPDVLSEQPVLLLILIEGGVLLLSYPFSDEWESNEELFGSFLTAFMSFSNEFFTEGLDRAKFGQYTVLMEIISKFSICYLYRGQTYLAKKKIEYFIKRLQTIPSILQTLEKFAETSQVIELKDFPFLEGFITEIFMSKNPGNIKTD
ncbi:MAG: tetratricopeptide repeat protein [Promethearchaeota archaeon]|jgi:tetratricopeptide (TPR) repeat protein